MHTTEIWDDENHCWVLHHNGDYSGEVKLSCYDEDYGIGIKEPIVSEIEIPFEVLEEFVGQKVNRDIISMVESWSGKATVNRMPR